MFIILLMLTCLDLNDCSSSPCENGGTCVDGNNSFKCVCPPGYGGKFCDVEQDPCNTTPCLNGGKCQKGIYDDYECKCATGYTGRNCQTYKRKYITYN